MKNKLIILSLLLTTLSLSAHDKVKIGPNGGHLLSFSKNETMHGEVTAKDGKFHVALLDKNMKPVAIDKQEITATTADRNQPQKLEVTKDSSQFTIPMQKGDDHWTIIQFKPTPDSKPVIARLHYNATKCPECKGPEWLCKCTKK